MPLLFEQPSLDNPSENPPYFDPGDGRLITVFTDEDRTAGDGPLPDPPGGVHHLAFAVNRAMQAEALERLKERGIAHTGLRDRGFMDSLCFRDPPGLLVELACSRFDPPAGAGHVDVLVDAHRIRLAEGAPAMDGPHPAREMEWLAARRNAPAGGWSLGECPACSFFLRPGNKAVVPPVCPVAAVGPTRCDHDRRTR